MLAAAEGRRRDAAVAGGIPAARKSSLNESRAATIAGLTSIGIGTAKHQEQQNERVINGEFIVAN